MNRQLLESPFTQAQIKHRKGNFNRTLAYVEAPAVIARLNDAFDSAWSFEITEHHILQDEVLVLGRLTAESIVKTQFGSSQITRNKKTGDLVSLGDDLKAAATDALKKASTLLGVGLHLYESEASYQKPMNGQGYHANPGYPDKSGQHGYPDNPVYPPGNAHHPPVNNGYHDPGHPQGIQNQTHPPVNGRHQGHSSNNVYRPDPPSPGYPTDQNIQTPKRLSSKQYQYLKQLASDRAISSQELAQLTTNKFGCTLDFLSSRQASELITELQQDKTAA
jgi:hypothetical protein